MKKLQGAVLATRNSRNWRRLAAPGIAINEAVPGTESTRPIRRPPPSSMRSAQPQRKAPGRAANAFNVALDTAGAVVGGMAHGGEGAGIGMAATHAVRKTAQSALEASAARKNAQMLAKGLTTLSSPAATRTANAGARAREAAEQARKDLARALASHAAPSIASAQGHRGRQ